MTISNEQKQRKTRAELEWLFCDSASDIGLSSNYSAILNAACFGQGQFHDPYADDKVLSAISRKRQLEAAYYRCDEQTQLILYANYSWSYSPEPYVKKVFSNLTATIYALPRFRTDQLRKLCQKAALGQATKEEQTVISAIRDYAATALKDAAARFQYELSIQGKLS